jgi:Holliday junction resolvasome RuvABC endonuclease subunit
MNAGAHVSNVTVADMVKRILPVLQSHAKNSFSDALNSAFGRTAIATLNSF